MPIYLYETADEGPRKEFEKFQSIKESPLVLDPETGRPVRRIITGGIEMPRGKSDPVKTVRPKHSNSCACCNPRPPR